MGPAGPCGARSFRQHQCWRVVLKQEPRPPLIPVPPRTRRPSIVRELAAAGLWEDDIDAWTLGDFFDAQLSAEEVTKRREYDAIRQRLRFAETNETREVLEVEEQSAKTALLDARERRRARPSQRESQCDPQRPAPTHPDPLRSEPIARARAGTEAAAIVPLGRSAARNQEGLCAGCGYPIDRDRDVTVHVNDRDGVFELHENWNACQAAQGSEPWPAPGCPMRPTACRRGYDRRWRAISAEAILRQPWCSRCGAREDLTGAAAGSADQTVIQLLDRDSARRYDMRGDHYA
jgi:hypothetical protein